METRSLAIGFELKGVTGRTIEGYAAAWARDRVNDIISPKAFDRTIQANPDVQVFVGHDSSKLPVGEPVEMRADHHGLFTRTQIYDTPDGDALLAVAKARLAKGRTLGMSIGFRSVRDHWDAKQKARVLEDVDLIEYSFLASPLLAANPQAVALGVKSRQQRKALSLEEDSYEDLQGDLLDAANALLGGMCCIVATFPGHVVVMQMEPGDSDGEYYDIPYTLGADKEPTLGTPAPVQRAFVPDTDEPAGKAVSPIPADSAVAQAAKGGPSMSELDDAAFAYVEPGGVLDTEQKTVPRTNRHVPHHSEDGSVDLAAVTAFLESPGDETKALPHMMEHAWTAGLFGLKSHAAGDRTTGTSRVFLELAYRYLMLADQSAQDAWAMKRANTPTHGDKRLYPDARVEAKALADLATQVCKQADEIERGEDGVARVEMFRTAFQLLDLEEVA